MWLIPVKMLQGVETSFADFVDTYFEYQRISTLSPEHHEAMAEHRAGTCKSRIVALNRPRFSMPRRSHTADSLEPIEGGSQDELESLQR